MNFVIIKTVHQINLVIKKDNFKEPDFPSEDLMGLINPELTKQYDMKEIIARIVDESDFDEYKENYGKTLICGHAKIGGYTVGIIANQRHVIKSEEGQIQLGGVIYNDSSDKAARFIMNCNQDKVPILFIHDVNGFMVGKHSEWSGIAKDGAKLVNAVSNCKVPKISIVIGGSYGAGNYAMSGRAYTPRYLFAWPSAKVAVMGGEQAAKVLLQIEKASLKAKGEEIDEKAEKALLKTITDRYDAQTSPYYAASRLWVEAIIDPLETRRVISMGIEAANNAPIKEAYNPGVIQS